MKRVIKTAASAAMYNPVSQATVASNGMLYTAGMMEGRPRPEKCFRPSPSKRTRR